MAVAARRARGIARITTFDAETFPVQIAGMVRLLDPDTALPDPRAARHLHRAARFGVAAAVEALRDAGVEPGTYEPSDAGVSMGASVDRPGLQEFGPAGRRRSSRGLGLATVPQHHREQAEAEVAGVALPAVARAAHDLGDHQVERGPQEAELLAEEQVLGRAATTTGGRAAGRRGRPRCAACSSSG